MVLAILVCASASMPGSGSPVGARSSGNVSIDEPPVCDKFANNGLGSHAGTWRGCGARTR
ncbi:Uncharacterised protein [Mycobacterium tuberculosis]|uniref:Uncharacterized protein n=1 Tax=Mycobacterium tuberculosis TaxID=1773 RepID=A0A0U0RWH2_MYCTX|nr:Uncharacterised protein [Mycobacterium tuberculosis]CKQ89261.1 Uncharacterised protein [Mycobacterium tuberculosis]COV05049.1 Uncharacterised protein [Mycobacterium tuberculosis]COV96073.1 Uncharacterised protein [Mycobacterium tuberculosis]COW33617.1 Uncharacterised protein [Mycobacterium tuberculosis]